MPKINQEEYEILKEKYDMGGKWISRDADGLLYYYKERPNKLEHPSDNMWYSNSFLMDIIGDGKKIFHFVKWSDSSPYNIAELIREYEIKELRLAPSGTVIVDSFDESEGTEVNKQKLIEKWESAIEAAEFYGKGKEERLIEYMREFVSDLNQLDEPKITELDALNRLAQNVQFSADEIANHLERLSAYNGQVTYGNQEILSQKWIDEHKVARVNNLRKMTMSDVVPVDDLQNLLVPKQGEVDRAYKDGYEKGKEHTFYKGYLEGLADKENEPEKVVVPKFVADWVEDLKSKKINLLENIYDFTHGEDIYNYIREQGDVLMRAWLDGYEVEEEQLFYVVDKYNTAILSKGIDCNYYPREGVLSDYFVGHEDYMFTEKEIKDYDLRYWAFRKPVEELEE